MVQICFLLFFLNCFWCHRSPYCLYSRLPPLREQPTVKCHPKQQPIKGLAVHCRLGRDCWIQTQDSVSQSGAATSEPPLLPNGSILPIFSKFHHSTLTQSMWSEIPCQRRKIKNQNNMVTLRTKPKSKALFCSMNKFD